MIIFDGEYSHRHLSFNESNHIFFFIFSLSLHYATLFSPHFQGSFEFWNFFFFLFFSLDWSISNTVCITLTHGKWQMEIVFILLLPHLNSFFSSFFSIVELTLVLEFIEGGKMKITCFFFFLMKMMIWLNQIEESFSSFF